MSDKKESLLSFMKKQASEKSSKNLAKKATVSVAFANVADVAIVKEEVKKVAVVEEEKEEIHHKPKVEKVEEKAEVIVEKEMTEEELLEDAKKASRNKAVERDQTEMIKKLVLQNIIKYTSLILVLVILIIGIIKFVPALGGFIASFIRSFIFGAVKG